VGDNTRHAPMSKATCLTMPVGTLDPNIGSALRAASTVPVGNELLCLVQHKCRVLALDQLVKLCADLQK